MLTFETKCWQGDWDIILTTGYLHEQILRNDFAFAERVLFINNVDDPDEVSHHARALVSAGVLTAYHVIDHYVREALEFFGLSRESLGEGYVYSVAELVGIYLCRTPYLLHFSGDSIPEERRPWIPEVLDELARPGPAAVANPVWNGRYGQAMDESHGCRGCFFVGYGFSDQCYLIRTNDFRARVYGEAHPLSDRYPVYAGELFEKRVDAWMRYHGRERLTHRYVSYRHQKFRRCSPGRVRFCCAIEGIREARDTP
jgi:hypothetical protein